MTIDKFGRYLHASNNKCDLNEQVINLVQNLLNLIQEVPLFRQYLPQIDLNKPEQFKAMSDPNIFNEYDECSIARKKHYWFRVWFEEKYGYKKL